MSNLHKSLEVLASQFAATILETLRSASIDELVGVAGSGARRGRPRAEINGAGASAVLGAARRRGRGGRLGRRSAPEIKRMIESIVALLEKSAEGMRAEQLREALAVEAKELPRPLAEAISTGQITKTGQKRATTYFAGSGGSTAKRRGRRAGARKKR